MLKTSALAIIAFVSLCAASASAQEVSESIEQGADLYRACAACHSLQPDVHLSGPSLTDLWGRPAGTNSSYGRYSPALESLDLDWNEDTLDAWLWKPESVAPGTTMAFRGIEDPAMRADLIAFLRLAMSEGGGAAVVAKGLIPQNLADGQMPPDLSSSDEGERLAAIRHCRDAYYLTTPSGDVVPVWETNLRLKIDSSARGPGARGPVLVRSGMVGDRVSVVFSSVEQLHGLLVEEC